MSKNPLRLVVARSPRFEVFYGLPEHESLAGWIDTLECGHQRFAHNFGLAQPDFGPEGGNKRHRCAECGAVEVSTQKKSVQSAIEGTRQRAKAAAA